MSQESQTDKSTELSVNVKALPPEDKKKFDEIVASISWNDTNAIMQYGVDAQTSIASFSDQVLTQIKNRDTGYVGETLSKLLSQVREVDVESLSSSGSFMEKIPLLGGMVNSAKRFMERYEKVGDQIEKIVDELDKSRIALSKDIYLMDEMFQKNLDYLKNLDIYIAAGESKLAELKSKIIPEATTLAEKSNDTIEAQKLQDLIRFGDRFEKKLHDLKLSRMISIQSGPQLRLIQSGNQVLVDKIQSSIINTIPLWKNQIVIAIGIFRQKKALELQKKVSDTTNELLQKNSELLKEGTIGIAKESERGIVEIETLKKVNTDLISTIEEVLKIQEDGHTKRTAAEQEMVRMEQDLKKRLSSASNT